jgi:hypothetical protein
LRASDDLSRVRRNVYSSYSLVVSSEFILQFKALARPIVYFDIVLFCDGKHTMVGGEAMVGDWVVEEMMNFGRCHDCNRAIGGALYYRL